MTTAPPRRVLAPLLFLDVDGAVNARVARAGYEEASAHGHTIRYRPTVIRWLNQLVQENRAVPVWLTTWTGDALETLTEQVGLEPLVELPRAPGTATPSREWWKITTIDATLRGQPDRRWAWVDVEAVADVAGILQHSYPQGLAIATDPDLGLSDQDIVRIDQWLQPPHPVGELVHDLNTHLGTTIVAALSGARVSTVPERWTQTGGPVPSPHEEERLRAAHRIWTNLVDAEGPDVARAWFIGANPVLEVTPYLALRAGRVQGVFDAATAFISGTWAE